jgi:hypothetical protein
MLRVKTNKLAPLAVIDIVERAANGQKTHHEDQSLDANPAVASLSSERRRLLNNRGTGSHHQLQARQSAGELEVHVSWIAAWRNDA